jgi:hypothetical protein
MSMEMRVYFAGLPPTCAAIEHAMVTLDLPFKIIGHVDLTKHSGYLPMVYGAGDDAIETGTEVYFDGSASTIAEFDLKGVAPSFKTELSFRWGGDMMECACAEALAAAVAKITGGIVYEDAEGVLKNVDEAVALARTSLTQALNG